MNPKVKAAIWIVAGCVIGIVIIVISIILWNKYLNSSDDNNGNADDAGGDIPQDDTDDDNTPQTSSDEDADTDTTQSSDTTDGTDTTDTSDTSDTSGFNGIILDTSDISTFTSGTNYGIQSQTGLERLASIVNVGNNGDGCKFYILNDITINSLTPIGTVSYPFSGEFDGQNYYIILSKNVNFTSDNSGLFGYVKSGTIKNITLKGSGSLTSSSDKIGGISGVINNGSMSYCRNGVSISGNSNVGGICGQVIDSNISNCSNAGNVSGESDVGGICGYLNSGTISDSSNNGSISESSDGNPYNDIFGNSKSGSVSNCSSGSNTIYMSHEGNMTYDDSNVYITTEGLKNAYKLKFTLDSPVNSDTSYTFIEYTAGNEHFLSFTIQYDHDTYETCRYNKVIDADVCTTHYYYYAISGNTNSSTCSYYDSNGGATSTTKYTINTV